MYGTPWPSGCRCFKEPVGGPTAHADQLELDGRAVGSGDHRAQRPSYVAEPAALVVGGHRQRGGLDLAQSHRRRDAGAADGKPPWSQRHSGQYVGPDETAFAKSRTTTNYSYRVAATNMSPTSLQDG